MFFSEKKEKKKKGPLFLFYSRFFNFLLIFMKNKITIHQHVV